MFKSILQFVDGFGIWAIISMIIFILFFVLNIILTLKTDKEKIDYMKNLPLEDKE